MKREIATERIVKTTLYQSVVEDIRARIEGREYAIGERLPSITVLCERYGVSNITISAALRDLVASGYVESRPRSGVFVRERSEQNGLARLNGECVVAFVVPGSRAPFWMEIIHGVEATCTKRGFRLLVASSDNDAQSEARQLEALSREVAGILVSPVAFDPNYAAYIELMRRGVPFVFVDHYLEKLAVPAVTTDNIQGGYLATRHLLETGRRRIFVIGEGDESSSRERVEGYRRALRESDVPFEAGRIYAATPGDSTGYEGMQALLKKWTPQEPFGVFAVNEYIARGAYIALREAGLKIPQDAAVIGFDDAFAPFFEPPLSTIRQDLRGMGASAVKLLLDALTPTAVGKRASRIVRLKPELIVRNSSDSASDFCLKEHFNSGPPQRAGQKSEVVSH